MEVKCFFGHELSINNTDTLVYMNLQKSPILIVTHKMKYKLKDCNTLKLLIVLIVIISSPLLQHSEMCPFPNDFKRMPTLKL